jgi:hypothetical protein
MTLSVNSGERSKGTLLFVFKATGGSCGEDSRMASISGFCCPRQGVSFRVAADFVGLAVSPVYRYSERTGPESPKTERLTLSPRRHRSSQSEYPVPPSPFPVAPPRHAAETPTLALAFQPQEWPSWDVLAVVHSIPLQLPVLPVRVAQLLCTHRY